MKQKITNMNFPLNLPYILHKLYTTLCVPFLVLYFPVVFLIPLFLLLILFAFIDALLWYFLGNTKIDVITFLTLTRTNIVYVLNIWPVRLYTELVIAIIIINEYYTKIPRRETNYHNMLVAIGADSCCNA